MKVSQLILQLKKLNPNADLYVSNGGSRYQDVKDVSTYRACSKDYILNPKSLSAFLDLGKEWFGEL